MEIARQYTNARRVGTPIIAVNTPDPAATMAQLSAATLEGTATQVVINGNKPREIPSLLEWDVMQGIRALNEEGEAARLAIIGDADPVRFTGPAGLGDTLSLSLKYPREMVLYVLNAHRFVNDPSIAQAVWNVRDAFKPFGSTLVLLSPGISLPVELQQDVLVLDEPLPDREQIRAIICHQYQNAGLAEPDTQLLDASVDALMGLAAFPAEQAIAMCLTKRGLNNSALWERKRQMIENTPGLSVWRGGEMFSDIGGVANIKQFLTRILSGPAAPKSIVFIDEIEKSLGGIAGDNTGVSQDYLGQLLAYMQDRRAAGMIFVGPPGSAKSMVAKAAGASGGIPTITLDLGGMKGSLVGQSEQALRGALRVVTAVSDSQALFIATCNSLAALPPELRRRFTFGTYYFDLPDENERKQIWALYQKDPRYTGIAGPLPADDGWTGAEIRQCCDLAWRLNCTLEEAAAYIVPVSKSAAEAVENLRTQASNRFISASYPGTYHKDTTVRAPTVQSRRVQLQD